MSNYVEGLLHIVTLHWTPCRGSFVCVQTRLSNVASLAQVRLHCLCGSRDPVLWFKGWNWCARPPVKWGAGGGGTAEAGPQYGASHTDSHFMTALMRRNNQIFTWESHPKNAWSFIWHIFVICSMDFASGRVRLLEGCYCWVARRVMSIKTALWPQKEILLKFQIFQLLRCD